MSRASALLGSWLAFASASCGEAPSSTHLDPPPLEAARLLVGFARLGRSVSPGQVAVYTPPIDTVEQPAFEGRYDGFAGGLDPSDLPSGWPLDALRFVSPGPNTRPLPALRHPHVLGAFDQDGKPSGFAPVDSEAREDRWAELTSELHIESGCTAPPGAWRITVPRLPAESYPSVGVGSDGITWAGMTATGTAALVRFSPDGSHELRGLQLPPPLDEGVPHATVRWMAVPGPEGPDAVVVEVSGGFSQAAVYLVREGRRFVDHTPEVDDAPVRSLVGRAQLGETTCLFGGLHGSRRDAGLWCREAGGPWRIELRIAEAQSVTGVATTPEGAWLLTDRTGSLHRREPDGTWRTLAEADINRGCQPACAPFDVSATGSRGLLQGGESSQLYFTSWSSEALPRPVEAFEAAAFADERSGGDRAWQPLAALETPNGAWWFGLLDGTLLRWAPEQPTMERVCLPAAHLDGDEPLALVSLGAGEDGQLVLGFAGGRIGFGRWR